MEKAARIEAYFGKESPFAEGMAILRDVVCSTELKEDLKWGGPVYTLGKQNVLGIMSFKSHFGLWFFNGVFLSDPLGVLENAQEGKTRAMRHWKFNAADQINRKRVRAYILEAIENARKGLRVKAVKAGKLTLPEELREALEEDPVLKKNFSALAPYKQRDFAEHIAAAMQQATRKRRLGKILPMIRQGVGLNDKYRKR